jgi:hypothetical protein
MIPRDLNNALQRRLAEYKLSLSLRSLREIPSVIRHYSSAELSREATVKGLKRILGPHVVSIPRKGARGGYDHIGTPDSRLHFLVEDLMAILDSADFVQAKKP